MSSSEIGLAQEQVTRQPRSLASAQVRTSTSAISGSVRFGEVISSRSLRPGGRPIGPTKLTVFSEISCNVTVTLVLSSRSTRQYVARPTAGQETGRECDGDSGRGSAHIFNSDTDQPLGDNPQGMPRRASIAQTLN